jgi:small nuclear ribonucleoprotein (snRNP)-like protein
MDSRLDGLGNRDFARALKELRGRNVFLLLFDGSAVFGCLGCIEDWVINVLPAVGLCGVDAVRFRPPNAALPEDILLSEALIDVCDICACVEGPFATSPLSKVSTPQVKNTYNNAPIVKNKNMYSRQQCRLLEALDDLEGQNLGVLLLGGWTIGGQLEEVCEGVCVIGPSTSATPPLNTITALNVFGPALRNGKVSLFGDFQCITNNKALSAVLLP